MAPLQSHDIESFETPAEPDPVNVLPTSSTALGEARELVSSGEVRLAVELLLRHDETERDQRGRADTALLLSHCYARLGLQIDTTEWLVKAQRRCAQAKIQSAFDATHVGVLHWFGHEVNAIRAANTILGRQSRRATDPEAHAVAERSG